MARAANECLRHVNMTSIRMGPVKLGAHRATPSLKVCVGIDLVRLRAWIAPRRPFGPNDVAFEARHPFSSARSLHGRRGILSFLSGRPQVRENKTVDRNGLRSCKQGQRWRRPHRMQTHRDDAHYEPSPQQMIRSACREPPIQSPAFYGSES